jgi:hypothetical protein
MASHEKRELPVKVHPDFAQKRSLEFYSPFFGAEPTRHSLGHGLPGAIDPGSTDGRWAK